VKLCNTFRMLCRADKSSVLGNSPVRKPSGCSTTMQHFPMSCETLIRRSVYSRHTLTLRYMRIGADSCLLILLLWDPKIFVGIRDKITLLKNQSSFSYTYDTASVRVIATGRSERIHPGLEQIRADSFHTHIIQRAFVSLLQDGPSGSILVWNRSERILFPDENRQI